MFSKSAIILLLITTHSLVETAKLISKIKERIKHKKESSTEAHEGHHEEEGSADESKKSKAPKLTPEQIENAKKFWKVMLKDHEKGEKGEKIGDPKGVLKPASEEDVVEREKHLQKVKEEAELLKHKDKKEHKYEENGEHAEEDKKLKASEDGEEDKSLQEAKDKDGDGDGEDKQAAPTNPRPRVNKYAMPVANIKHKMMHSGGMVFMDGLFQAYIPLGDRYSGMPDGIFSMGKYCAEFVIKGLLGLIYTTIRWPHKVMLKVVLYTAAAIWIVNHAMWCLNPFSISNWLTKAKLVNQKADELADAHDRFKVRLANTVDRVFKLDEIQKQTCCAYQQWKMDSINIVPNAAKAFVENWMDSVFKLELMLFCGEYAEGADNCKEVIFIDDEPLRIMPRGSGMLWVEIFLKFY